MSKKYVTYLWGDRTRFLISSASLPEAGRHGCGLTVQFRMFYFSCPTIWTMFPRGFYTFWWRNLKRSDTPSRRYAHKHYINVRRDHLCRQVRQFIRPRRCLIVIRSRTLQSTDLQSAVDLPEASSPSRGLDGSRTIVGKLMKWLSGSWPLFKFRLLA